MFFFKSVLALLAAISIGCGSADESVRPGGSVEEYHIEANASPEELYFELVRLHSTGLLAPERMDAVLRVLDDVDSRHEEGSEAHHEQQRVALTSSLRRALRELRQGDDAAVAEAQYDGRAYARKLNRTGVREAERYAENTLLIAGMMGVPTGEEDLVLMVAIPVGGYVVVKMGDMALKRAVFLMRKLRSVDDMERLFGYAGRERQFDVKASLGYIEKATGLKATSKPVAMLGDRAPVGHYAVFTRWSDGGYRHVVYGRVTPTGRVVIFDPQSMEHMTYQQMLKRYGKAMPYLLEMSK
jgi:hypothetical protein